MKRRTGRSGYALLAAVLITALAAVFSTAAVAAVGAALGVQASDTAADAAAAVAGEALDRAIAGLTRRPDRLPWACSGSSGAPAVAWDLTCTAVPGVDVTAAVRADVVAVARSAAARRRIHAVVELRPAPGGRGLAVAHDVTVAAPLVVSGGGLYSGGSVSGREYITFVDPAGSGSAPPADHVRGDVWPVAAVHALGGIWASGVEEHDGACTVPDTDVHAGSGDVESAVEPPSPALETLLSQTADVKLTPGGGGVVDLGALPAAPPAGAAGLVVFVVDPGAPVTVSGARAAGACAVVLVLEGDARLGSEDAPVTLTGAVLSLGALSVCAPTSVLGHLWASSLAVDAPLVVETPADWRRHPFPGLVDPRVLALGR